MDGTMGIGIVLLVIPGHRIDYALRLLRSGRVIEVDELLAIWKATAEDWEVRSDGLDIQWQVIPALVEGTSTYQGGVWRIHEQY